MHPIGDFLTRDELANWRAIHRHVRRLRAGGFSLGLEGEVDYALRKTGLDEAEWRSFAGHVIKRI